MSAINPSVRAAAAVNTSAPLVHTLVADIGGATTTPSDVSANGLGSYSITSSAVSGSIASEALGGSGDLPLVFVSTTHGVLNADNNATYHMSISAPSTDASTTNFDAMFHVTLTPAQSVQLLNAFDVSGVKLIQKAGEYPSAKYTDSSASAVITAIINGASAAVDLCGSTMESFLTQDLNNQLLALFGAVSASGTVDSALGNTFNTAYNSTADVPSQFDSSLVALIQVDASSALVTVDSATAAGSLSAATSGPFDSVTAGQGASLLMRQIPYDNLILYDNSANGISVKSLPLKGGDTIVIVFDTDPSFIHMTPTQNRGITKDNIANPGASFDVTYKPAVRALGLAITVDSGNGSSKAFSFNTATGRFTAGSTALDSGEKAAVSTIIRNASTY